MAVTRNAAAAAATTDKGDDSAPATDASGALASKRGDKAHSTSSVAGGPKVSGRKRKKSEEDEVSDADDVAGGQSSKKSKPGPKSAASKTKLQAEVANDLTDLDEDGADAPKPKRTTKAKRAAKPKPKPKGKKKENAPAAEEEPPTIATEPTVQTDDDAADPSRTPSDQHAAPANDSLPESEDEDEVNHFINNRALSKRAAVAAKNKPCPSEAEPDTDEKLVALDREDADVTEGKVKTAPEQAAVADQMANQAQTAPPEPAKSGKKTQREATRKQTTASTAAAALGSGENVDDAVSGVSDAGEDDEPAVTAKKTAVKRKSAAAPSGKAVVEDDVSGASDAGKDDEATAPKKTKRDDAPKSLGLSKKDNEDEHTKSKMAQAPPHSRKAGLEDDVSEIDEDKEGDVEPAQHANKPKRGPAHKPSASDKQDNDSDNESAPAPPRRPKATVEDYVSDSDEDEENVEPVKPPKKTKRRAAQKSSGSNKQSKDAGASAAPLPGKATVEDDGEGDKMPTKPSKKKAQRVKNKRSKKQTGDSDEEQESVVEDDAEVAELDDAEAERVKRHTKPGPLTKEEAAEFEEQLRVFEQWMMNFATKTGKSLEYLWNLSRIKLKLKRDRTIWNMFQERWSMENPREEDESLYSYHERRRTAYAQATEGKTKKQKADMKKELLEWADKCDEELAKLTIEAGDTFKVMHRLGDDIDGLTRPYWANYRIATFGFMLCAEKADPEAIAMNCCFSNTPIARKWLTGKHVNVRSLLADFANLFGVHIMNEAEKEDWSRAAFIRFGMEKSQYIARGTVKRAFRGLRRLVRGEPSPGDKDDIPWTKLDGEVLLAEKRVVNWPDGVPLPSAAKGKWNVPAQKTLMRFLFQALRRTSDSLEETEDTIAADGTESTVKRDSPEFDTSKILRVEAIPQDELDKRGTDWDGWYSTPIWTTRSGKVLLHVGDLVGKLTRYGNHMFPAEMVRPTIRKVEGFDEDDDKPVEQKPVVKKHTEQKQKQKPQVKKQTEQKPQAKPMTSRGRNPIGGGRVRSKSTVPTTDDEDADAEDEDEDGDSNQRTRTLTPPNKRKRTGTDKRREDLRRQPLPSTDDEDADSESEVARPPKKSRRSSSLSRQSPSNAISPVTQVLPMSEDESIADTSHPKVRRSHSPRQSASSKHTSSQSGQTGVADLQRPERQNKGGPDLRLLRTVNAMDVSAPEPGSAPATPSTFAALPDLGKQNVQPASSQSSSLAGALIPVPTAPRFDLRERAPRPPPTSTAPQGFMKQPVRVVQSTSSLAGALTLAVADAHDHQRAQSTHDLSPPDATAVPPSHAFPVHAPPSAQSFSTYGHDVRQPRAVPPVKIAIADSFAHTARVASEPPTARVNHVQPPRNVKSSSTEPAQAPLGAGPHSRRGYVGQPPPAAARSGNFAHAARIASEPPAAQTYPARAPRAAEPHGYAGQPPRAAALPGNIEDATLIASEPPAAQVYPAHAPPGAEPQEYAGQPTRAAAPPGNFAHAARIASVPPAAHAYPGRAQHGAEPHSEYGYAGQPPPAAQLYHGDEDLSSLPEIAPQYQLQVPSTYRHTPQLQPPVPDHYADQDLSASHLASYAPQPPLASLTEDPLELQVNAHDPAWQQDANWQGSGSDPMQHAYQPYTGWEAQTQHGAVMQEVGADGQYTLGGASAVQDLSWVGPGTGEEHAQEMGQGPGFYHGDQGYS